MDTMGRMDAASHESAWNAGLGNIGTAVGAENDHGLGQQLGAGGEEDPLGRFC
ncbi:hypothetical protein GCM10010094_24890 [Streptomyces flaveus]|uniref:Uncharacterized protein n=1 Tax=Streptomyces flaveus TaxID=66370 RepID=A0A917QQ92_9ACTN|nr:hypothetical protein GCM10010094_24890 [Streptomyces flaveus]